MIVVDASPRRYAARTAVVAVVVVGAAALVDLSVFNARTPTGRMLIGEVVVVTVFAWAVRRHTSSRPARGVVVGLVAAAQSVALTAILAGSVLQRSPGLVAAVCLAAIIVDLCRHLPARWLVAVPPVALALLATPARLPSRFLEDLPGGATALAALVVCAAVAAGLLLRSGDADRRAAQEAVRREERVRLAHDLHDDVAHHVTGVVVAAQAGAQVAVGDPERARLLFERIETTGQDGLTAIGRAVRLLRAAGHVGGAPPTLDDVRDLVDRFSRTDLPATLHVASGTGAPDCSGAGWTLVARVVQEGLTNVRKHAGATTADVTLDGTPEGLTVSVRDDGGRTRRRPRSRFPSSGVGLTGLSEQVRALGGDLTYGAGDTGGWTLTARIPRDRT